MNAGKSNRPADVFIFLLFAIIALVWVLPFVWMVSTSFKLESATTDIPLRWIPSPFTLENYEYIIFKSYLLRWLLNSVVVASVVVLFDVFINSMAAYSFARIRFPGRDLVFALVLATLMVPQQVTIVPLYLLVNAAGLVGTYPGIFIPRLAMALGVFMMRQFFLQIPREYEEAAEIEGAGRLLVYRRIMMPLVVPALSALAIFAFLGAWNDFMWPLIVSNKAPMFTLPVGLANFSGTYQYEYAKSMAAATIASLPVMLVFLIFQKQFIQGVAMTGLKG
jgi:multiple sugar transport system permease protein